MSESNNILIDSKEDQLESNQINKPQNSNSQSYYITKEIIDF